MEMGGSVREGVAKIGRWMAKLVACVPACYGSSLGSNQDISQKYKMGDINKRKAKAVLPAKNVNKTFQRLWKRFFIMSKRNVWFCRHT